MRSIRISESIISSSIIQVNEIVLEVLDQITGPYNKGLTDTSIVSGQTFKFCVIDID